MIKKEKDEKKDKGRKRLIRKGDDNNKKKSHKDKPFLFLNSQLQ